MPRTPRVAWSLLAILTLAVPAWADSKPSFTRTEDVIYGRRDGSALTLDVFTPTAKKNGAAVIWVVSGGWFSSHDNIDKNGYPALTGRGYTVFAVVHRSQPRFTIQDAVEDMNRSVRWIRHNAGRYGIDPNRIGITGGSAGGHLSLMIGLAGTPGNPKAADPVDRQSSRVGAVACFFPPTDFLNWGGEGTRVTNFAALAGLKAPFAFHEFDTQKKVYRPIEDDKKLQGIARDLSPITHVSSDDPPVFIVHGDKDTLVPLQQAEVLMARLKENKVPAKLVVKPGLGHGWPDMSKDVATFADWFDTHLAKPAKPAGASGD